jgi:hypothetical protein
MSTNTTSTRNLFKRAWELSPALVLGTGAMLLGSVLTLVALVLDPRQLVGEPVWLKPFKFYVSLATYNATLLYVLASIAERSRFVRRVGTVLSVCGTLEMVCITLQAARGVRSHFNAATLFDVIVFQTMGLAILVLWVTMMVLAVALLRAKMTSPALASALRLGVVISVVGMGTGWLMTLPHNGQFEALKAGAHLAEQGAHSFGTKDGGPGLPLVGWSVTAGDMRPAHFLGLHAIQALPVLAVLLARRRVRSESHERAWIRAAGVAWLGLTLTLALQAWRGLPVVQWDTLCMASLAGVGVASLVTFAASLPRRQPLTSPAV